ncbi:MAG: alcohol dehydrogenase catalytic domain-containing protein [Chloroflexi bacterium]|nr:alcohol dehydrogenase catalytic domain-containing protein [Chloroflexota bacterium]
MKVARLHGPHDLRLHDEPDPIPGPDQELIRITTVGLCGSDRHWFMDGSIGGATVDRPLVLGHEIAGVIDAGPRRGERVAIEPADACETCDVCRSGRSNLCETTQFAGHGTVDGGLRTLMAWPSRLLTPIPDSIEDPEAALLEPLGVALHAWDLGKVRPGMAVAVFGCGPIGLLLIRVLRARECGLIVAVEPLAHRRAAALVAGATVALEPGGGGAPPVDVAFELSGEDEALAAAIDTIRPGGRVVLVGIPSPDRTTFPASAARRKGLTLLLARRMAATALGRATELVAAGTVSLSGIVSERHPLDDVEAAFAALVERRGTKIVIALVVPERRDLTCEIV